MIDVNEDADGYITIDDSQQFFVKARKYTAMLSEINVVTKTSQTELHAFRVLDELEAAICDASSDQNSKLHGCKLCRIYTGIDSHLVKNRCFENCMIKL